jgi:hypothetical protein
MSDRPMMGREARVARTGEGQTVRNALALPRGSILLINELGRPMKSLGVRVSINKKAPRHAVTDDYGRIYPLVHPIDEVSIEIADTHESETGDSVATPSGQHFEHGGDGPRGA